MKKVEALTDAAAVLSTEANELAKLLDAKAFGAMYHRVQIAVRNEMNRLREIERGLLTAAADK